MAAWGIYNIMGKGVTVVNDTKYDKKKYHKGWGAAYSLHNHKRCICDGMVK